MSSIEEFCTDLVILDRGKTVVKGNLNNQFSMDEYEGNLRLATTSYITVEPQKDELLDGGIIKTTLATRKTTNNLFVLDENLKEIGKKPSTISRNLASIRAFYQFLVKNKKAKKDPTMGVQSPKIEKKAPSILTSKEVELLLEQPKDVNRGNSDNHGNTLREYVLNIIGKAKNK